MALAVGSGLVKATFLGLTAPTLLTELFKALVALSNNLEFPSSLKGEAEILLLKKVFIDYKLSL